MTPANQELKAQGIGNIISGLVGGLPITQVIVRSLYEYPVRWTDETLSDFPWCHFISLCDAGSCAAQPDSFGEFGCNFILGGIQIG